jgi:phosphate transport system protein
VHVTEEARRTFHHELDELRERIVEFAALVAETIPRATQALLDMDLNLAKQVIEGDDELDARSLSIEESCHRLLALQQPMAGDLRAIVTAVKLNWELERSADLAVNLAKTVRRIYQVPLDPRLRGLIQQMGEEAYLLTSRAVEAYATGDAKLAQSLDEMDDPLDALQAQYVHTIIDHHDRQGLDLQAAVQLALIGRYYERIGDHAVNVGERIWYMITGIVVESSGAQRGAEST